MPTPVKPCDGHFSEDLQQLIRADKNRAQWASHPCEVCGLSVEPTQVKGKWVPLPHWPSVSYRPRKTARASAPAADSSA
jgi:hypothetical protein